MQQKLLLTLLTLFLVSTTTLYFVENNKTVEETSVPDNLPTDVMYTRKFFEEPLKHIKLSQTDDADNGVYSIVSYEVEFQVKVDEHNNDGALVSTQGANINGIADVYTKYHDDSKMYDVAVAYRDITKFEEYQGDQNQAPSGNESESDEMTMFIISVSGETGAMSNFRVPDQGEPSKYLKWATEQLITNIFPEIRPDAYKPEFAVIEQDNFGNFKARYTASDLDKNEIKLHKEYTSNDYLQKAQDYIENPQVVFDADVTIDKELGVATVGHSKHLFTVGDMTNAAEEDLHTMGKYQGSIIESFAHRKSDEQAKFDIQDFINKNAFKNTELHNQQKIQVQFQNFSSEMAADSAEEQVKLTHHHFGHCLRPKHIVHEATKHVIKPIVHNPIVPAAVLVPKPVQHVVHQVVEKPAEKIVKETVIKPAQKVIEVTVQKPTKQIIKKVFKVVPKQIQMSPLPAIVFPEIQGVDTTGATFSKTKNIAELKVLKNKVAVDLEYYDFMDHTVLASFITLNGKPVYKLFEKSVKHCVTFDKEYPKHMPYELFQVTYPIYGVIWLRFEVKAVIDMNLAITGTDTVDSCVYSIVPTFKAAVEAEGSVSLVNVIKAGVWAKGYFLDAELDLSGTINRHTFTATVELAGKFHAYSVKIGYEYTRINCHLKHFLKNLVHMKKLCDVKPNTEKLIYSKDSKPIDKVYFHKEIQAKW